MTKITKKYSDLIDKGFNYQHFNELKQEFPFLMSRLQVQKIKITRYQEFFQFYTLLMDSKNLSQFKFRHLLSGLQIMLLQFNKDQKKMQNKNTDNEPGNNLFIH